MFSKLFLKNFKAFDELNIGLRPITLLLGPNNSGKSSIIAALRLIVQTIESLDPDVPLLLNGAMGDMGTFRDIVFGNHRGRPLEIAFSINDTDKGVKPGNEKMPSYWSQLSNETIELKLFYKFRSKRRELILEGTELKRSGRILFKTTYSPDSERQLIERIGDQIIPSALKASLTRALRMQNFLPTISTVFFQISKDSAAQSFFSDDIEHNSRDVGRVSRMIARTLENTDYIGAMRVPPSRVYAYTGEKRRRIGASGENAANILAMDAMRGGTRSQKIAEAASNWLKQAGIAENLSIDSTSDRFYEIRVKHPLTKEIENLADVGLGNSQIMPVLVGGYSLGRGSTYLIEEPEIHLHPKAQAELGSFLLDLYNNGVQTIAETHSEHLIVRLQQYIADRKISPDDVQIYYVYPHGDKKEVKSLHMDSDGMFTVDWPEGFFPERLEEAKKLAKIRYQKQAQGQD